MVIAHLLRIVVILFFILQSPFAASMVVDV